MGLPDIDNIPDTGAVFTIGRSRFAENVASHFFIRKDPVVSVTCGDEHSAVVCQSGRLFVFGSNDWGQLGLGHKNHVSKPSCVKILKPEKVTHVACGRAHTLICTGEQKIFACGSDQESQLGRGGQTVGDSSSSPFMIWDSDVDGPKICDIAAGSHHSLALMKDGTVYAWGSNLEGQLGLPGTSGLVNKPTKVHVPEAVKQISAGYYHSAFLTESGNVYVCGEAESGKLGIALDFRTQVAPKQMQLSGPAILVACGGHHTLVFGEDGNIYCTGSNSSGQLGMGTDITEIQTPQILPRGSLQGEIIKKIGCGESHVAIVTESGKLFTCGDGRHGKLGLEENENNVHELTLASKYQELVVTDVACGGCHTILVGRRREMDNEEIDGQDQLGSQKKNNPLPPLKIPLARIPSGNGTSAKSESEQTDAENNLNEEHPASPEVTTESGTNGPTDSIASVEKPESPMKIADYEETISKMSTNSDEKDDENERVIDNNNDEKMSTDVNNENNIDEMKKESELPISPKSSGSGVSRIASGERARSAGSNAELEKATGDNVDLEKSAGANADLEKLTGSSANLEKLAGSKDDLEESVDSNGDLETGEKVDSPPLPVPPPKPPRQKIGSAENSQSSRQGSSSSRVGSTGSAGKNTKPEDEHATESALPIDGGELVTSEEEKTKSEDGSEKKSAGSEKSRSAKSKAGTDETAEADAQNNLDDVEDNGTIEDVIKVVQDDTDVVHSPPTRAGKMAKLFKTKKQEVENGTKASSAVITKAKSKTCIIL